MGTVCAAANDNVDHHNAARPHRDLSLETPRHLSPAIQLATSNVVTCSAGSSMSTGGMLEPLELTLSHPHLPLAPFECHRRHREVEFEHAPRTGAAPSPLDWRSHYRALCADRTRHSSA